MCGKGLLATPVIPSNLLISTLLSNILYEGFYRVIAPLAGQLG